MAGQEQIRTTRPDTAPEPAPDAPAAVQSQVNVSKVDDILDEIDGVLETNAEDFVKNFVQKGGE